MEWNITSMIGAVTLTMKQLGFGTDDIDLTVFGTIRIYAGGSAESRYFMDSPDTSGNVVPGDGR